MLVDCLLVVLASLASTLLAEGMCPCLPFVVARLDSLEFF